MNIEGGIYIITGYEELLRKILLPSKYDIEFYNQIKRTNSNRRTIDNIKQMGNMLNSISDYKFTIYLYQDGRYYQLDLYSKFNYEGSIRDNNLKQLSNKFKDICLEIKQYLYDKLISVPKK